MSVQQNIPIRVGDADATVVEVHDCHGPNWFPFYVSSGRQQTTLYLRRAELHALRLRLDEIDDGMPEVEE